MTEETYKKQQPFAGAKKPSMLRRFVGHDYTGRQMYMITMVTEGRRPLFGQIEGHSEAPAGSPQSPCIRLTQLGMLVEKEWWACSDHHPEIDVIALQMMPDHLHGILFVKEKMEEPLGMAIRGFKQSCNKHYRRLILGQPPVPVPSVAPPPVPVPSVALATQQTGQQMPGIPAPTPPRQNRRGEDRSHGMLFARGYNDRLLLRQGQLEVWINYLADNPRRLLMKREHPALFRVQRDVTIAGLSFSALGNLFLAQRPVLLQVQCSRRMTDADIETYKQRMLAAARGGAVLVSPSISPGEKAVMRAAFSEGLPLIFLQENGLTDLAKPGGRRMEACARGQMLILAPWEHHNERTAISRGQCLTLNDFARQICNAN